MACTRRNSISDTLDDLIKNEISLLDQHITEELRLDKNLKVLNAPNDNNNKFKPDDGSSNVSNSQFNIIDLNMG